MNWILDIQRYARGLKWSDMDEIERIHITMYALTTSIIVKIGKTVTLPQYHQGKNSLMVYLRQTDDIEDLVKLIDHRTSCFNYQRKTSEVKAGQLKHARNILGEFRNTIMLRSELAVRYPTQTINWCETQSPATSSSEGFRVLMKATASSKIKDQTKADQASGFSRRARQHGLSITSVNDLIKILTDGEPHHLQVQAGSHAPWVLAYTTLDPDLLQPGQGHIWACWPRDHLRAKAWGNCTLTPVQTLFRMPKGEVFFLCENARLTKRGKVLGNFNFPEFLNPRAHACKTAYEALNKVTHAEVPTPAFYDRLAVGFCACPVTSKKVLDQKVKIILDGKNHTLISL